MTKPTMTLTNLTDRFSTEEACKQFLTEKRWPNGVECPRCHNKKVYELKSKPFHWVCKAKECGGRNGYRFSVITKTVFENTNYPLRTWFQVVYLMTQSKKGISALQIHRQIGSGDYRTAWYMCHRIRAAMKDGGFSKLMGEVEVDETFMGGSNRNRHRSKRKAENGPVGKVGVIGAIARKGNVVCQVIESVDSHTLVNFVRQTVSENVSLVATDEYVGYTRLKRQFPHQTVNHAKGEYVARECPYGEPGQLLEPPEAWRDGDVPSGQQKLFAAVPGRVFVSPQQPEECRHFRRCDSKMLSTSPLKRAQMRYEAKNVQLRLPMEVVCRRRNRFRSIR